MPKPVQRVPNQSASEQVRPRTRVEIHADTWMPKPVQRVPNQSAFTYFGVTSYPDSCRDPCGHLDAQTGPTAVHPERTIKTWTVESRPHWRKKETSDSFGLRDMQNPRLSFYNSSLFSLTRARITLASPLLFRSEVEAGNLYQAWHIQQLFHWLRR
jgi:hypothetical protein